MILKWMSFASGVSLGVRGARADASAVYGELASAWADEGGRYNRSDVHSQPPCQIGY